MKTKISVLLAVFWLLLFSVRGSIVTVQDAQNVALNFFKTANPGLSSRTPLFASLQYTRIEADGTISLYVFDIGPVKGFVIVSASDYDDPIIGYSTESAFGAGYTKTGLNNWLNMWGQEITYVEKKHIVAEPKVAMLWTDYRRGIGPVMEKSSGIGPLCTTTWNQSGNPGQIPAIYNEDCPYDINAGTNTLTGCVATAMAQIMKYWNYPVRGAGVATYNDEIASGFSNNYGVQSFNFSTNPFNWANMPDSLTVNSTAAQDSAVSLLNYACGAAVSMDYGAQESGAWVLASQSTNGASSQQAYGLYFKYNSNTLQGVLFTNYAVPQWLTLIENELNEGRPVQYQGYDVSAGAHTWVCDGYNTGDMMHMNWGWGGLDDGWYAVTNLNPNSGNNFTYNIGALIGIQPGVEAIAAPPVICSGDTSILSIAGGPASATYSWAPSTGLSCTTCASTKAFPTATTAYTVVTDSAGNTVTSTVIVYVNQPRTLNYTLSDTQLCMGNSANLSFIGVSGVGINPAASVYWRDSLSALLTPDSTTTYFVTTQSSVCGMPDTANITVRVNQYVPVTINLSATTICYGSNATLTYSGLSNVEVTPSGYSYTGGNNIIVFAPLGTTGFSVSGTTSCGSVYTDTFTIAVNSNTDTLSYTLLHPTICMGDTAILRVSNATNVQVTPAGMVTPLGNYTYLLVPDSNTTFYVTGFSVACGGQASVVVPVKVIQSGLLNSAISNQDLCVGGYEYIYLYGVTGNAQSNPPLYFYFSDSTDAYAYFVADSTTTYHVSATTICGVTSTANINIEVLPQVSYNLQRPSICAGDSTLFTVLGLTGLNIYPTSGFRMIDSGHYEFHPSATTTYELDGYDCTGAYNYHSFTINVVQPGVLNYTLQDSNLCSAFGTELLLNGIYNPQITPFNYLYLTDSTDYYTSLSPSTNTTYTINGQSICSGATVSASFTVYVFPKSGFSLATSAVCPGSSTTLKVTGLSGPSIYPTNTAAWINDSVIRLSPTTETDYALTGTDCTGQLQEYNVIVGVLSDTNVTYTVDSELCSGNQAYLTISAASDIVINPPVNLIYTDSFDAYVYLAPTANTTYTFSAVSECTNARVTDTFHVYMVEDPGYLVSPQSVCGSDSVVITILGLDNVLITPNSYLSYINANSAYLYPPASTTYNLSGNSSCTGASYNQQFTIYVDSMPTGSSLNISESNDTLYATSAGAYQWMLNGNPIQGAVMQFIVPTSNGAYTVELGAANGCKAISNPFIITAIGNLTENQGYSIFPNPSTDRWTVKTKQIAKGNTCEIFDAGGRRVYYAVMNSSAYEIDADLASGVYLLKILNSGRTMFIGKLIKL